MASIVGTVLEAVATAFASYLVGVGAICLAGGVWLTWRRLAILARSVRTTGTIVHWERQRDADVPSVFQCFPHVRFVDATGRQHDTRIDVGSAREKYPLGTSYPVRYDPHDPSHPANLLAMLIGPLLLALLGAADLAAGMRAFL
jgi:hypothetical protein